MLIKKFLYLIFFNCFGFSLVFCLLFGLFFLLFFWFRFLDVWFVHIFFVLVEFFEIIRQIAEFMDL